MYIKKKRNDLDLQTKIKILKDVDLNIKRKEIANKYGIDASTLSKLVKNRETVEHNFSLSISALNGKRSRESPYTNIDEALTKWFQQVRSAGIPVSGPVLGEAAEKIANEMGMTEWKCSNGFLERFKKRHNISFKVISGESASVNPDTINDWINRMPDIINGYNPDDIFNMDETGLFYKVLPEKTLTFRGEKCSGGKRAKERLTVIICSNMSGTEKMPLLVIGKSQNPRCLRNVRSLPVTYKANKRAWITGELFEKWLLSFDSKMRRLKRNVLLFIDNCPAHVHNIKLIATRLIFFPANTTSVLQPCDQGIIYAFKQQYRKRIVRHLLHCMESGEMVNIDIKLAIYLMHAAWNTISQVTISNCFQKANFRMLYKPENSLNINENEEILLQDEEWTKISGNSLTFDEFVMLDNAVVIAEMLSEEEIARSLIKSHDDVSSTESVEDITPLKTLSYSDFIMALETVHSYIESKNNVPQAVLDSISNIQDFAVNHQWKPHQPKITKFFLVDDDNRK